MNVAEELFDIPRHWVWTTMGEIADVVGGSTPKSKEESFWGGEIPWLGVSDLTGYTDKYISGGARSITKAGFDSCSTKMLPAGTVLFSSRAPIGYVAIAERSLCTSQGFKSFVPVDDVLPEYLYWYLRHIRPIAEQRAGGTTFRELSTKAAAALPVPLPPRREQQQIVAAVERLVAIGEDGRQRFQAAATLTDRFRRSVLRDTMHRAGEAPTPESPLPPLPSSWRWSTVADEGEVKLGRMRAPDRHFGPNMRPYLRVANVLDDCLDLTDVAEMDFPPDEYERYRLRQGDILLNEGQSPELLGRAAMWRNERPDVCYQKTLIRFRAGERVNPEFALLVFRHYLYAGRFRRESRITTGIGHLTAVRFAAIDFPVPPLDEQAAIVAAVRRKLDRADRLERDLRGSRERAAVLEEGLLRRAFKGGFSTPSSDEAAGPELWERARVQLDERKAASKRSRKIARAVLVGS